MLLDITETGTKEKCLSLECSVLDIQMVRRDGQRPCVGTENKEQDSTQGTDPGVSSLCHTRGCPPTRSPHAEVKQSSVPAVRFGHLRMEALSDGEDSLANIGPKRQDRRKESKTKRTQTVKNLVIRGQRRGRPYFDEPPQRETADFVATPEGFSAAIVARENSRKRPMGVGGLAE
ncbi:hypothetical protein LZ30DRAFT_701639 [Colletotrichum cereale]|nr:hypothetical protein LZ30DRAFT_701639 [Colletotrichum cereale]